MQLCLIKDLTIDQSCYSTKIIYRDKKKLKIRDHKRGILGENTGKCHVICIKYGEMGAELLLSNNEIQGQEKIENTDHIRGILGGKYGEMPSNLHQIPPGF